MRLILITYRTLNSGSNLRVISLLLDELFDFVAERRGQESKLDFVSHPTQ